MRRLGKKLWWLLLLVPVGLGLARLRFDAAPLHLLPGELPVVQALRLYQQHFADERELLITVRAPEPDAAEAAAQLLATSLRRETNLVGRVTWQPPWLEHPEEMGGLIAYLWLNQPPAELRRLADQLAPDHLAALLQSARDQLATSLSPLELGRLSYDPFGFTRLPQTGQGGGLPPFGAQEGFASADGTFRVLFVEARSSLPNYRATAEWLTKLKSVAFSCTALPDWPPRAVLGYTGAPAFLDETARGMERDLRGSASATVVLIALLFWWAHRDWRPLLWLLGMLALVVAGTLAAGGLLFHSLNAVSLGFAAILMGLAVDYGLVLYEESRAAPGLNAAQLRRLLASSIAWSAVTTAGAFALLNFGGLPGLCQLGSLVAIGILLAAVVMLYLFAPIIVSAPKPSSPHPVTEVHDDDPLLTPTLLRSLTLIVAVAAGAILAWKCPGLDHSTQSLQPRHSPAQLALNELQTELHQPADALWLLVRGADETAVADRLDALDARLAQMTQTGQIRSFLLPVALWPHPAWQRQNLPVAGRISAETSQLRAAARQAGFTPRAFDLAETILRAWQDSAAAPDVLWPTNSVARWMLKRATASAGSEWFAAGVVQPGPAQNTAALLTALAAPAEGVWLTGWSVLGEALLRQVEGRVIWLVGGMLVLLAGCLWLAFRCVAEVVLSFAALGLSLLVLLAIMGLAGWSWNLMNLMALPVLLGCGVDYTIHVQLALRRHQGRARAMRRVTGRAVFLCAATTVAGFGSNAASSNAGLASLGLVCGAGLATVYLTSVFLLPPWWQRLVWSREQKLQAPRPSLEAGEGPPSGPSSLYGTSLWRAGLALGRRVPRPVLYCLGSCVAEAYWLCCPQRRRVVRQNLLPVLDGDRRLATRMTRRLFRQFALKMVDLWRYESGLVEPDGLMEAEGWSTYDAARRRGRGVLLVTLHLGNWEIGGPLLARRGVELIVLTQPEPGRDLTALRSAARARWGIETIVVGEDPFAFVEIIQRLERGQTVALLLDRPQERGAATLELFGRPFRASLAAAELARASGCALVGVVIARQQETYRVEVLPEFGYDRRTLGNREARRALTQQILRAFEPKIRQYPDQWFHFVDIWPPASP